MKAGLNLRTLNALFIECLVSRHGTIVSTPGRMGLSVSHSRQSSSKRPCSDSAHKFMATLHDLPNPETGVASRIMMVKGAPDALIARCGYQAAGGDPWQRQPIDRAMWLRTAASLSSEGLRVLALCQRTMPQNRALIHASDVLGSHRCRSLTRVTAVLLRLTRPSTSRRRQPSLAMSMLFHELQLNCLVAIVDPPRDEAITAVESVPPSWYHGKGETSWTR